MYLTEVRPRCEQDGRGAVPSERSCVVGRGMVAVAVLVARFLFGAAPPSVRAVMLRPVVEGLPNDDTASHVWQAQQHLLLLCRVRVRAQEGTEAARHALSGALDVLSQRRRRVLLVVAAKRVEEPQQGLQKSRVRNWVPWQQRRRCVGCFTRLRGDEGHVRLGQGKRRRRK